MYKKAIKQVDNKIFAKKVLKVVKKQEETKHAQPLQDLGGIALYGYANFVQSGIPAGTSSYIELTSIFNTIGQGTGQGDRIGNRISPNKFIFHGFMNYNNSLTLPLNNLQPMVVKMFIFRMKNTVSAPNPDMTKFFQYGNTSQAPTGYIQDMKNKVNSDDINLYATRTFKLAPSAMSATASNNDFKLTQAFKVDLTKYVKKVIYDDTTATIKNHQIFVSFLFGRNDCQALAKDANNEYSVPIQIGYTIEASYKDD